MKKKIKVTTDAIVYMFSFLEAGVRFSAKKPAIHNFFYRMSKKEEFSAILGEIIFDTNCCSFPYSENVEDALSRLILSNLISLIDLGTYEITAVLAKKVSEDIFSQKERVVLQEMAKIFFREIGAWYPEWHKNYQHA